jgi:hypothetical protein
MSLIFCFLLEQHQSTLYGISLDSVATMYILISSRIFFVIDLNLMIEQRPTKVVLTSVAGFKLRLLY